MKGGKSFATTSQHPCKAGPVAIGMHTRRGGGLRRGFGARCAGVLDLRGTRGRWFGGLGASAARPTLLVSAAPADTLVADGEDAERARFARLFLAHHHLRGGAWCASIAAAACGARLGDALALAVARALAELYDVESDGARACTRAVGRGKRSAIGTWTFDDGGLVVEGGRRGQRRLVRSSPDADSLHVAVHRGHT